MFCKFCGNELKNEDAFCGKFVPIVDIRQSMAKERESNAVYFPECSYR